MNLKSLDVKSLLNRFREKKVRINFIIYNLYLLGIIAIILPLFRTWWYISIISISLLGIAVSVRISLHILKRLKKKKSISPTIDWSGIRIQLKNILSESKILLDAAIELKNGEISSVILTEAELQDDFFLENKEFVEKIREIGIDGLLCLLFLLQQQPAIASVRAMQRTLHIPLATTYRCLQKMSELDFISTHYMTDNPGKALYRITDLGSSIIINLFEVLGGSMIPPYVDVLPKPKPKPKSEN